MSRPERPADAHDLIRVQGARENNLKDVSVELPKRRLTVFTGISGSGKSSLVFATIAAESQRLINETYSAFIQGFMATMALGMWLSPRPLVTLFLADNAANAAVIGLAVSFLQVAAAFQLVDGAQVIGAGMLRGLHDTRWPLLFALFGYWVVGLGIGAWLAFAADWQGVGIWVGLASGLAAVAVLMLVRWVMRDRLGLSVAR